MAGEYTEHVRRWCAEECEGKDDVSIPMLYRAAMEEFDSEIFRAKLLEEHLHEVFRSIASKVLERTRPGGVIKTHDRVYTTDVHRRKATVLEVRMMRMMALSGGSHKRIGAMRRENLRAAMEEHKRRITSEQIRLEYLQWIDSQLPNDQVTVEEVLTEDQLVEKWNEIYSAHKP